MIKSAALTRGWRKKSWAHVQPIVYGFVLLWAVLPILVRGQEPAISPLEPAGQAETASEEARQLAKVLAKSRTFSADFHQILRSADGEAIQETQGHLDFSRPGLFRWQTEPPLDQLVVSDGDQLWVYDKDLAQVSIKKLDWRLSQTPALLLSGEVEAIGASFHVSRRTPDYRTEIYLLIPKSADSLFEQLTLVLQNERLSEMKIADSLGQKTSIEFAQVRTNRRLDKALFEFVPPPGVDVISE